jgi:hypothetical protein
VSQNIPACHRKTVGVTSATLDGNRSAHEQRNAAGTDATALRGVHEHAVHEEFFKEHMRTKGKELAEACVAIIGQLAALA